MLSLLKTIAWTSPALLGIWYYIHIQQSSLDVEIKKDESAFERSWNEFERDFSHDPKLKKEYQLRADKAGEKLKEFEDKAKKAEEKKEQFGKDMEKVINEVEEEARKKEQGDIYEDTEKYDEFVQKNQGKNAKQLGGKE